VVAAGPRSESLPLGAVSAGGGSAGRVAPILEAAESWRAVSERASARYVLTVRFETIWAPPPPPVGSASSALTGRLDCSVGSGGVRRLRVAAHRELVVGEK
jgi:hypothetical protein